MKLIRQITDLNKAINKQKNLGFVPTMGGLHKGHEFLIRTSKKLCKKTLVTIFVNPNQFNDKNDFKDYPRNLNNDLKILKKLNVDFVYLPSINQVYKDKKLPKIKLNKTQKILCAKFRKGHFEGVLDVLNRFIILISPKIMFMGIKDYQQYFLVKNFISEKYNTKVYPCKTIRNSNGMALSSRNKLLSKKDLKTSGLIANILIKLKKTLCKKNKEKGFTSNSSKTLVHKTMKSIIKRFNIHIEYMECRNLIDLTTNLQKKPFKIFVAYYLSKVRLIDNF